MKISCRFSYVIALLCLLFCGCTSLDYPTLNAPPISSMILETSDFGANFNKVADPTTSWGHAATLVTNWDAMLFAKGFYAQSLYPSVHSTEAEWNRKEGLYEWEFTAAAGYPVFSCQFTGDLSNDRIYWALSMQGGDLEPGETFVCLRGGSQIDGKSGNWHIFRRSSPGDLYFSIAWDDNGAGETLTRFGWLGPGQPEQNSYIEYRTETFSGYNRYYDILEWDTRNKINIEWDFETKAGRIRDSLHFGDTLWHCWDAARIDTNC